MPAELQYTFTLKDEFETTLEDVVVVAPPPEHPDTLQEARKARCKPQPTQPTKQEMEEHALTHALQKLVSYLCQSKRQTRCLQTATIKAASHTD